MIWVWLIALALAFLFATAIGCIWLLVKGLALLWKLTPRRRR